MRKLTLGEFKHLAHDHTAKNKIGQNQYWSPRVCDSYKLSVSTLAGSQEEISGWRTAYANVCRRGPWVAQSLSGCIRLRS